MRALVEQMDGCETITGRKGAISPVVYVEVRESEDVSTALRRFKQKCIKESIFQDIRKNAYYEKPSVRKRKKHMKALKRLRRNQRKLKS